MPHQVIYRDTVHLLREVSRIAHAYEGYARNSYIVEGSRRLASMIERGFWPEETWHWIASSIVPNYRGYRYLSEYIHNHFDADFESLLQELLSDLYSVSQRYTPERDGVPNLEFQRIFTTPEDEFVTLFPGDNSNYSYRETLAHENISEPEYSNDSNSDVDSDSDEELDALWEENTGSNMVFLGLAEDDFINPEDAPEYEQYPSPLPLYENRYRDELLLSDEPPIYSEFSLEMMLMSMTRSLA